MLWILGASSVLGSSQAAPPSSTDSTQLKQRLAALQSRMAQVDQQMESLKKRRKGVMVELQGISLQRDSA